MIEFSFDRVEKIVGKEGNAGQSAGHQHFLFFFHNVFLTYSG